MRNAKHQRIQPPTVERTALVIHSPIEPLVMRLVEAKKEAERAGFVLPLIDPPAC